MVLNRNLCVFVAMSEQERERRTREKTFYNEVHERESRHILLGWIKAFNRITLALVALGLVALLGHEVHRWALQTPIFELKRITVRGNHLVSEETVLGLARIEPRCNLFRIDVGEIRERLAENCFVRRAEVQRRLPSSLVISIEERKPVALLESDGGTVDEEGVLLHPLSPEQWPGLPVLSGVDLGDEECGEPLQSEKVRWAISFIRAMAEMRPSPPFGIGELDLSDIRHPLLYPAAKGVPVRIGGAGCLSRLASLPVVLADMERKGIEAEYIDARFLGQIIVRPISNRDVGLESPPVKG
ncbi:MAG: cell division protein FtsQ/DivIB [bacterium]